MEKQIVITVEGGVIQHIATNFEDCQIKIIDFDNEEPHSIKPYEPDEVKLDQEIIEESLCPNCGEKLKYGARQWVCINQLCKGYVEDVES